MINLIVSLIKRLLSNNLENQVQELTKRIEDLNEKVKAKMFKE